MEKLSKSKSDIVEIVVNLLGDSAGAIPVAGAFITAVKNVGINVYHKIQQDRIYNFLNELYQKVENIEYKFNKLSNDDQFLEHFYKVLYRSRERLDDNEYKALLGYIKKLLNGEIPADNQKRLFYILENMNPLDYLILSDFYNKYQLEWIDLYRHFFNEPKGDKSYNMGIDYNRIDPFIHNALLDMVRLSILEEKHHSFYDENSNGYLEDVKISSIGNIIIELINQ